MEKRPMPIRRLPDVLPLLVIIAVAILVRLALAGPGVVFDNDLPQFVDWNDHARDEGLLRVYATSLANHPPLPLTLIYLTSQLYPREAASVAVRLAAILIESTLVGGVYMLVRHRAGRAAALVTAAALALHPVLLMDSVWFGQNDALMTLFIVGCAVALDDGRIRLAWALFGFALLSKFQSLAILPVLIAASVPPLTSSHWRELFGGQTWLRLSRGVLVGGVVFAFGLLPFLLGSGRDVSRAYFGSVGRFPGKTVNAWNFWYWTTAGRGNLLNDLPFDVKRDDLPLDGLPLTAKQAGLLLLVAFDGVVALRLLVSRKRAIPLAMAVICIGFFMLPTQIHERYLYPAVVLLSVALFPRRRIVDWRALILFVGFSLTLALNLYGVLFFGASDAALDLPLLHALNIRPVTVAGVNIALMILALVLYVGGWPRRHQSPFTNF